MCSKKPTAAIVLIVLGLVFLARNFGWLQGEVLNQWWPLLLIVVGAGLLLARRRPRSSP